MELSKGRAVRRGSLLTLLVAVLALGVTGFAQAASVDPVVTDGNPSCAELNSGWSELKIDNVPKNQTYSNADLSVTISNVSGKATFDWSATHSIDAVIVKASTPSYIYNYNPESFGDTNMSTTPGHDISHVSFCYDAGDASPPGEPGTPPPGGANNPPPGGTNNPPPADHNVAPTTGSGQPQSDFPSQLVLGERIGAVRARLISASGCAARTFSARVRGAGIAKVVFRVDGKRVKTIRKGGQFIARVNPARLSLGVHRLVASVTFTASSHAKARTLRASFQRCAKRLISPRFTG